MRKLQSNETELRGEWHFIEGNMEADETCKRIEELTRHHLRELGADESGWDVLYIDPADGRYWELTNPQGGLQGGGPPKLTCISADIAKEKYGLPKKKRSR